MLEEKINSFDEAWLSVVDMVASIMRKLNIPLSDEDAWQEARIAVWDAWKRFDPERGRFSTVCYRYVFNALIDHRYTRNFGIPYPRHMYQLKEKVRMPVVVSLDERVESRFDSSEPLDFVELIPDKSFDFDEVDHRIWRCQFMDCVRQELADVDGDDYHMLKMWFGLDGEPRRSLKEIGDRFGLSREGVRLRINKVIRVLRSSERISDFLNEEAGRCIPD